MGERIWVFEGMEFGLDLWEAGAQARYAAAVGALMAGRGEGGVAGFCARMRGFLGAVLGEGAGERLLPRDDVARAGEIAASMAAYGRAQARALGERMRTLLEAYDPQGLA